MAIFVELKTLKECAKKEKSIYQNRQMVAQG